MKNKVTILKFRDAGHVSEILPKLLEIRLYRSQSYQGLKISRSQIIPSMWIQTHKSQSQIGRLISDLGILHIYLFFFSLVRLRTEIFMV